MPPGTVQLRGPLFAGILPMGIYSYSVPPKNLRGKPLIPPLTNLSTKSVIEILFETFLSS